MRAIFLFLVILLSGCVKDGVFFVSSTQLGIEVNTVEDGQQTARIGYSRSEATIMPVRDGCYGELLPEAYPLLSVFEMDSGPLLVSAFTTTAVRQIFVTGKASLEADAPLAVARMATLNPDLRGVAVNPDPNRDELVGEVTNLLQVLYQIGDSDERNRKVDAAKRVIQDEIGDFDVQQLTGDEGADYQAAFIEKLNDQNVTVEQLETLEEKLEEINGSGN